MSDDGAYTKNASFLLNTECDQAFQYLKAAFVTVPVLMKFDPDQQIVIESDASDYVTERVMSQYDKSGILRPVAYFLKSIHLLNAIMQFTTKSQWQSSCVSKLGDLS